MEKFLSAVKVRSSSRESSGNGKSSYPLVRDHKISVSTQVRTQGSKPKENCLPFKEILRTKHKLY